MLLLLCRLLLFFWQVTVAVPLTLAVIPLLLLLQNSLFDSHTHTQTQKSECCFKYLYLFCSSLFIRNAFFLWLERRIWFLFWNIQKRALFSQRLFRPTERNNYEAKYYGWMSLILTVISSFIYIRFARFFCCWRPVCNWRRRCTRFTTNFAVDRATYCARERENDWERATVRARA